MKTSQTKNCPQCNKIQNKTNFSKHKTRKDGLSVYCRDCSKLRALKSQRTKDGIVTTIYSSQKLHSKRRGYEPPKYNKHQLKEWLFSQDNFEALYQNWIDSNYLKGMKPSIDRKDDYKPYSLNNIRLLTWDENNQKGIDDRVNGINNKMNKAVIQYDLRMNFIKEFHSSKEAQRQTGINQGNILKCCSGKYKKASGYIWKYKK